MNRRGFTMIELVLAISLGASLVMIAQLALSTLTRAQGVLRESTVRLEQTGIGHRVLSEALAMAEASEVNARPFFGDAQSASFESRCPTASGWTEPCDVLVQALARGGQGRLQVKVRSGEWLDAVVTDAPIELRYLERTADGVAWRSTWGRNITRPAALAVIVGADTTIYRGAGS